MPIIPLPITDTANTNVYPSILVGEDTAVYASVDVDKDVAVATQLDVVIDGSFLLRSSMLAMQDGTHDSHTVVLRWPSFWFDVYVTGAPVDGIDAYDARSDTFGPVEHLAVLAPNDGIIGFWSGVADNWPDAVQPAAMTIDTTTITITDGAVLALFTGASGTRTVYVKPRMTAITQSVDGGTHATPDQSVVLTETFEAFLGTATVTITR